jgi:excisionase family DNA binding protein
MKVIVTTQEELESIIKKCVDATFKELLPGALRMAKQKEWLTTDELMNLLSCSRRHIQYLRDEQMISFHQTRRTIRYHIDDVHDFMNKNRIKVWER